MMLTSPAPSSWSSRLALSTALISSLIAPAPEPLTSSVRQALSRRQTVRPLAFNCVLIATGYWTNAMRTYARLRSGANSGPAQNSPPLPIPPPLMGRDANLPLATVALLGTRRAPAFAVR